MSPWRLVAKEVVFRPWNCLLGICAVALAVGTVSATLTLLDANEQAVRTLLGAKETETRQRMESLQSVVDKAMAGLGFNIVLLPEGQDLGDWHSSDYATRTMPAAAVDKIRKARPRTIEQPVAQLRQKVKWPETKWTIILVGTEGRILADAGDAGIQPIPPGTVWLGHEIHSGLGMAAGQSTTVLGREFRIGRCLPQEGNKDDITVWMSLADSQALLDKPGLINEIVAVESRAAWGDPDRIRVEIGAILPGIQVMEEMPKAVTALRSRLNAEKQSREAIDLEIATQIQLRRERLRTAGLLNAAVVLVCAGWIALLAFGNAGERKGEVGIWAALGVPFHRVALLFWTRWLVLALAGAMIGFVLGVAFATFEAGGRQALASGFLDRLLDARSAGLAGLTAVALAVVASGVPVIVLSRQDPAGILQEGLE